MTANVAICEENTDIEGTVVLLNNIHVQRKYFTCTDKTKAVLENTFTLLLCISPANGETMSKLGVQVSKFIKYLYP